MRILYIGSFTSPRSTENAYRYAFENLGHTVIPIEQKSAPRDGEHAARDLDHAHAPHAVLYTRTHNDTALGGSWTTAWRRFEERGVRTASIHLDVFVGVKRHGMAGCYDDPLFTTRHVFTPDPMLAEYIDNEHTTHHWLPPAADVRKGDPPGEPIAGLAGKVVFVGSRYGTPTQHPEYPWRAQLLDSLRAVYNNDFYWYGGGSPLGVLRGKAVWDIYASDCVVVGDSCFAGTRPYYWSDRVPETLAHRGLLIHPEIEGILEQFPTLVVHPPNDLAALHHLIAHFLEGDHYDLRSTTALNTLVDHTYVNRAAQILETIGMP